MDGVSSGMEADPGVQPTPRATRRLPADPALHSMLIAETVTLGRELWVRADGSSMHPMIPSGCRVLLAPRRQMTAVGDIVLVRIGLALVLHRAVAIRNGAIRTRGDACVRPDRWVDGQAVAARAIACSVDAVVWPVQPSLRFGARGLARYLARSAERQVRGLIRSFRAHFSFARASRPSPRVEAATVIDAS